MVSAFFFAITFLAVLLLGVLFPGYLLLRILGPKTAFTSVENLLYAFALGLGISNFTLLIVGAGGLPITPISVGLSYIGLLALFFAIIYFRRLPLKVKPETAIFSTKKEWQAGLVIVALIFFVKVFYLGGTLLPTSTDLGHHLYWAKLITDTQSLPAYEKQEIVPREDGSHFVSEPVPISDFIIGEHLPLSFFHLFTGASYFGTFPVLFLFLLNLGSVLAFSLLFFFLGKNTLKENGKPIFPAGFFFLAGLFVFGVLFSLASPEMKFVSGGVIGNLFGNFFIPLILLLLIRTLSEKNASLLSLFFLLIAILAYTHHLSTFILLYILIFFLVALVILWRTKLLRFLKEWLSLLKSPAAWGALLGITLFAALVALPTYLETNAVGTAVGTPTKDTRTGLTFLQLTLENGAFKLGLSVFALGLILALASFRKNVSALLLFSYGAVLLIMTLSPALLWVDIPSNRIAHYLNFPLTLLSLWGAFFIAGKYSSFTAKEALSLRQSFFVGGFLLLSLSLIVPGLEENSKTLSQNSQALYVEETFAAARYLESRVTPEELILKDHNFIQASDTWMKLFFSNGYNYPFSRSYFKRYEDNPDREQCTLAMIATPNTAFGKRCYQDLPVRFVVVNPNFDQAQFLKSSQFSLIYQSPNIAIFQVNSRND